MKKWLYIFSLVVLGTIAIVAWVGLPDQQTGTSPKSTHSHNVTATPSQLPTVPTPLAKLAVEERSREQVIQDYFSHSINFYGKVVNEIGEAIPFAETQYSVYSEWVKPNQKPVNGPRSNEDGIFAITGKKGASIFVRVFHPEFYETEQSKGNFSYADPIGFSSSSSNPVIFVLHQKRNAEPLVAFRKVKPISRDGKELKIDIANTDDGKLFVQAWTSPPKHGAVNGTPFAWKCRISVPGGGLITYDNAYQFVAPDKGYVPFVEFEMPEAGRDGKWRGRFEQLYFLKLSNGRYARIRFQLIADGDHFVVVEGYYNPANSRNLEYDPAKKISRH